MIHLPTLRPRKVTRWYDGTTSSSTTAATSSAEFSHTPNAATSTRPIATQTTALTARRLRRGSFCQRLRDSPSAPRAAHHALEIAVVTPLTSGAFRRSLAQQALRTEHEDQDENREHDRLRPVGSRRVPGQPFVEGLDEADAQRTEDRARQVADPAQHRCGERDQTERE